MSEIGMNGPEKGVSPEAIIHDDSLTGEEQQAYEKGIDELGNVLYNNEQASDALLKVIQPENKVETTTKTVVTLISQIDDKLDLVEGTIHSLTMEAADRLIDLAEAKGIKFSERETEQVAMAAWEGVMGTFGGDESMEGDYKYLSAGLSDTELEQGKAKYQELKGG